MKKGFITRCHESHHGLWIILLSSFVLKLLIVLSADVINFDGVVYVNAAGQAFADAVREDFGISGFPVFGYHISNWDEGNRWPRRHFASLIQLLQRHFPCSEHIVTFAPGEKPIAERLAEMSDSRCHVVATPRIKDLGTLQQRCHLLVTVDVAPNHMAASLGTPTSTLFGGSDPVVWGPWGSQHRSTKISEDINAIRPELVFKIAVEMIERLPRHAPASDTEVSPSRSRSSTTSPKCHSSANAILDA